MKWTKLNEIIHVQTSILGEAWRTGLRRPPRGRPGQHRGRRERRRPDRRLGQPGVPLRRAEQRRRARRRRPRRRGRPGPRRRRRQQGDRERRRQGVLRRHRPRRTAEEEELIDRYY